MRQKVIFEIDNINSTYDSCDMYNPKTGYCYGNYVFVGLEKDLPDLLYIEHNKVSDLNPTSIPSRIKENKLEAILKLKDQGFGFDSIKEMIEKGWV